jgi:hypothetical protein
MLNAVIFRAAVLAILGFTIFPAPASAQGAQTTTRKFSFEQYPVKVYRGRIKLPRGVYKDSDGAWRDKLGKWVSEPEVNFAGEYYLAAHSCGTCCRYYQLTNLRTGRESNAADMFNAAEPPPRTSDGHTYVPILFFRLESRLLVVQYELDPCSAGEKTQCRQRFFVFEGGKFRAISEEFKTCTDERGKPSK